MEKIDCDVLLLAGESDHYIPKSHFSILYRGIKNAKSLTGKLFTESEGDAEHCQAGNHKIAIDFILNWLKKTESTTIVEPLDNASLT